MGFIQTIKNKLGIGGVKVSLQVPGQIAKDKLVVDGKITLTSKSDQEVVSYTLKLVEVYTTGRGDDKKTTELELGQIKVNNSFVIKAGDTKEFDFSLPFALVKSDNDELKEKGGAMGALGKLGSFANNEKSTYFVNAEVDVKSAALDPSDKKDIRIV